MQEAVHWPLTPVEVKFPAFEFFSDKGIKLQSWTLNNGMGLAPRLDEGLTLLIITFAAETLYVGFIPFSTQLIKPDYLSD